MKWVYIVILLILGCLYMSFSLGERYYKLKYLSSAVYEVKKIDNLQKELTDFANNQKELYRKTHNGY